MTTSPEPTTADRQTTDQAPDGAQDHQDGTQRWRRVAAAAGLTAAGVAGGVALDRNAKQLRLPLSRRRSRRQAVREAIAKRLP